MPQDNKLEFSKVERGSFQNFLESFEAIGRYLDAKVKIMEPMRKTEISDGVFKLNSEDMKASEPEFRAAKKRFNADKLMAKLKYDRAFAGC